MNFKNLIARKAEWDLQICSSAVKCDGSTLFLFFKLFFLFSYSHLKKKKQNLNYILGFWNSIKGIAGMLINSCIFSWRCGVQVYFRFWGREVLQAVDTAWPWLPGKACIYPSCSLMYPDLAPPWPPCLMFHPPGTCATHPQGCWFTCWLVPVPPTLPSTICLPKPSRLFHHSPHPSGCPFSLSLDTQAEHNSLSLVSLGKT